MNSCVIFIISYTYLRRKVCYLHIVCVLITEILSHEITMFLLLCEISMKNEMFIIFCQ